MSGPGAPIGVFDSGVGGLTVARAIADQLPGERLHYACNTASAACLADARERYSVPVVEVVRPAVRRAVAATHSGRVGVIGTRATIRSRAYPDAFAAAPHVEVTGVACPRFVDFVERGRTSGRQVLGLAQSYLEPLQQASVDTLVLGCTHYPMLTGVLQIVMGDGVTLVSSAEETAKDVLRVLTEAELLRTEPAEPEHQFNATGDPVSFARLARRFLGPLPAAPTGPNPSPIAGSREAAERRS